MGDLVTLADVRQQGQMPERPRRQVDAEGLHKRVKKTGDCSTSSLSEKLLNLIPFKVESWLRFRAVAFFGQFVPFLPLLRFVGEKLLHHANRFKVIGGQQVSDGKIGLIEAE